MWFGLSNRFAFLCILGSSFPKMIPLFGQDGLQTVPTYLELSHRGKNNSIRIVLISPADTI